MKSIPHPVRVGPLARDLLKRWGDGARQWNLSAYVEKNLSDVKMPIRASVGKMAAENPFVLKVMEETRTEYDVHYGSFVGACRAYQHRILNAPIFTIAEEVVDYLAHTDLEKGLPVRYIEPPFPMVYVALGDKIMEKFLLKDLMGRKYYLEGAYVHRIEPSEGNPGMLEITLCGVDVQSKDPNDDVVAETMLLMDNLDLSLEEAFDAALKAVLGDGDQAAKDMFGQNGREGYLGALAPIVKSLLFLNCEGVRMEYRNEKTRLLSLVEGKKSDHKRAKLLRQVDRAYDQVYITLDEKESKLAQSIEGVSPGHRATHWRRGHFRQQAWGPNWSMRRLKRIPPCLVGGGEVKPRNYKVVS